MYCPTEKYYTLHEIVWQCVEASIRAHTQHEMAEMEDGRTTELNTLGASGNLLAGWIFSAMIAKRGATACSPRGDLMKVGGPIISHEWDLGLLRWSFPSKGESEISPLLAKVKSDPPFSPWPGFPFIDINAGAISVSPDRERKILQSRRAEAGEDVSLQIEIARNFHGWALCFSKDEYPFEVEDILKAVEIEFPDATSSVVPNGRPRMVREKAGSAYHELFPSGHSIESWREVTQRVSERVGRPVSYKTIQRALAGSGTLSDKA